MFDYNINDTMISYDVQRAPTHNQHKKELCSNDSDESVRNSVIASIYEIGFRQPNTVLALACEYLNKNQKIDLGHRVTILKSVHQILGERRDDITEALSLQLIAMSISEMTRDKDVVPDWQQAASSLMVSLGLRFPTQIMDELVKRFETGMIPHYFIMKTLGDFIASNPLPTVPRIRDVLSRVLPVLASIKLDNIKWVFAAALGNFSEAIVAYVSNITDPNLHLYSFSSEFYPAMELIFSKWLSSNHEKVRLVTIQAVGSICGILAVEQLDAQVTRLIGGILPMFKKEKDLLPVCSALSNILEQCIKHNLRLQLEPQLPAIFQTLHPLVCVTPDFNNPSSFKTFNEVLRCFEIIGRGFSDPLVHFLSQRLEIKDSRSRGGSLSILRHIITRLDNELGEEKKCLILSAVKPLVQTETSLFVKKHLAQAVIAMASHRYIHLQGGECLIEFIIRGSSYSTDVEIGKPAPATQEKKKVDPLETVTEVEFRKICDDILHLITTTIPDMDLVLWPYLFESVTPVDLTGAAAVVARCLGHIAWNKRETEAEDYYIDFDKEVNLPKPTQIIARYFVLLTTPHRRGELGSRILEAMRAIGPILHPSICDMWDVTLPKLANFLTDQPDLEQFNRNQWEELVLRLLSETIKNAADDEWTVALGSALADQIDHYKRDPILKRSLYKQLGLIMQKCSHKEFVKSKIEVMFNSVDYTNPLENEGCAIGLGYCAASHFDILLEKIGFFIKNSMAKKGGFFKKSGPKGIKNCVLLSLAYAATYAQPSLLSSRVEVHMLNPIKPSITLLKKPPKKISAIKMIDFIGKALHADKIPNYIFKQRDEMFKLLLSYMSTPPPSVNLQVKIDGVNACSTLINLQPMVPLELETQVINLLLQFYATQPNGQTPSDETEVNQMITAINNLFSTILFNQPTIACLNRLIQYLDPLSRSKESHLREKAMFCILYLVKKYIEYSTESEELPTDKKFENIGASMAIITPRCTDPESIIRKYAVESIQLMLYIDYMLKNATHEVRRVKPIDIIHPLTQIKESITTTDVNEQFTLVFEISGIISKMIVLEEIPKFLECSLKGLQDLQTFSTNGSCIMINGLIKSRGGELIDYVPTLVKGLLGSMEGITSDTTMNGTLVSLRSLANHHLIEVLTVLLDFPMPHTIHVIKSLQIIAKDKNLVVPTITHLMDLLNNKPVYEDKPDPKDKKKTIPQPYLVALAATCSIGEILQVEDFADVAGAYYCQLFSTLALRAGTTNNSLPATIDPPASNPKAKGTQIIPSQQLVASFRQFFKCTKEDEILEAIEAKGSMTGLETPTYHVAIQEITAQFAIAHPDLIKGVFEYLIPYQRANHIPQRIITIAVFSELINHTKDKELLQRLINTLLNALVEPAVKLISLKGLSNIVSAGEEQTNRYAPTVIDAISSSIDDADEVMAMESMLGLSKIFTLVNESRVAPILVNICNRIKPAFEKPNNEIRAASFTLFGSLWRFGSGMAADPFYEQIHYNLPAIVMHLNDESPLVRDACKVTLRHLSKLLRTEEAKIFFHRRNFDVDGSLDYDEFLDEFSKLLIALYIDRINYFIMTTLEYYKSNWTVLRGNAATLTGFILGNLSEDKRITTTINPTIITKSLISLLSEKSPLVRKKAADSLSLLHTY
ncbi:hypothetical protein PPL_12305 [Heterostelium album PN500]|uniref:Uncharacterized protein n=1 Tax=Heterostelium pallidum (strain ATCC 26659 / Pp 5 / PN500) TaxID=670386 RepID=D3BM95_HETP5|nr:hypothetical protein PPL_12305 [Heterostelium album PN500]EFA77696.1 hypothetical protein PPL_12305 [Heterostelium album PN500]|eukprot:XP_020429824.1 hypothetical protein PPL_12305 [Heterostelium album PN500]